MSRRRFAFRALDVAAVLVLAISLFWALVPSSVFLRPHSLAYQKVNGEWRGVFDRTTPWGPVRVSFTQRMTPSPDAGGTPAATCSHTRPLPLIHETGRIIFRAPEAVLACLENGARPISDVTAFYVWIGPLRLRPVYLETTRLIRDIF